MRRAGVPIRTIIAGTFFMVFLAGFTSCTDDDCLSGSGSTVSVELGLPAIHSVHTKGSFLVTIEQASAQRVVANGKQNIINALNLDVVDGVWEVELDEDKCFNNIDLEVRIFIPDLQVVRNDGSGNLVLNTFNDQDFMVIESSGSGRTFQSGVLSIADYLSIVLDGSGDVDVQFNTQNLNILSDGSGSINILGGAVSAQDIVLAGSGNVTAFSLDSDRCTILNSGSGNVEVSVSDSLDVTITGSGNVRYKGNPVILSMISGSGSLIDAN